MRLFDRLFTRRRRIPAFARLPQRVRKRLASACGELDAAEAEIAEALDLPQPPRLLLIDEEESVILTPGDRTASRDRRGDRDPSDR